MILGISASGRKDGVTGEGVKAILKATGLPYEYVSLAGKKVGGCTGCTLCASDNTCKVRDDWNEIGEKMRAADAIVFGAPNYFGRMNALGHACWERTFSFRHREIFNLAGKLGVIAGTDFEGSNFVKPEIEDFMLRNKMVVVEALQINGYSQCYTCGYGQNCGVGSVVKQHGFLDEIKPEQFPPHFQEQPEVVFHAGRIGKILGSILKNREIQS
ncbi:flavodoxin family protein [Desulfosporosinus sp. PR]|uniref:flavodoxin family protein n=1 Tax=Candidatus Desulfosporosinus nitrosoreducens TaxID=3401928 RepID=UPI0027F37649|nr:flavodoxin family protein [Desulfosporosinus sp. PR]MDQ7092011.1 flavodoxin family protein [Desulfosporosinus sp. PR]